MSEGGLYEIDDVVWDEFGETDDHIVPDPENARESAWTVNGEWQKKLQHEILNAVARNSEQKTLGGKHVLPREKEAILSCASTKEELLGQIPDMDTWCDIQDEELAISSSLVHVDVGKEIKVGRERVTDNYCKDVKVAPTGNDLMTGPCKKDPIFEDSNATIVNKSCHLSLADICPSEGDLMFFGNEHEDKDSCSFLDYGWAEIGNFEDVDRLLSDGCSRNCESTFGHTMNSSVDELLCPTSSSDCIDYSTPRIAQHGRASSSPELRAFKGKSQEYEIKMEFMPCDNSPPLALLDQKGDSMVNDCQQNDFISDSGKRAEQKSLEYAQKLQGHIINESKSLCEEQVPYHAAWQPLECSGRSEGTTESEPERVKEDPRISSGCTNKATSYRKQRRSHAQPEEKYKKQLSDQTVTQNFPPVISNSIGSQVPQFKPSKTENSVSSALQVFPSPAHAPENKLGGTNSLRQVYPQVPYIHAVYGYPLHHMTISPSLSNLRSQVEQPQPAFVDYQLPADTSNQQQHIRKPCKIPVRLPILTPQEKIKKLKWRQKMQARLAVEIQQQKFGAPDASVHYSLLNKQPQQIQCHYTTVDPKEVGQKFLQTSSGELDSLTRQENSSVGSELTHDDDDGSLEATVLHQLLNVITQLDIRTRLCIQDALYRLARNAMKRHCVGDTNSSTGNSGEQIKAGGIDASISGEQSQSNRCMGVNDVETETNPIDRSIAHLLFHKCPTSSEAPVSGSAGSSHSNIFINSGCLSATLNPRFWPIPAFESQSWFGMNPKGKSQIIIPGQSLTSIPDISIQASIQNGTSMKGSYPTGSCGASAPSFDPRVCSPLSSMGFQNGRRIKSLSKQQGMQQKNDTTCVGLKCNPLAERGGILDNCEGSPSQSSCKNPRAHQSVKERELLPQNIGNSVKQNHFESMEVDDVFNTDSNSLSSEQFLEVGAPKKSHFSHMDNGKLDHVVQQMSPVARSMPRAHKMEKLKQELMKEKGVSQGQKSFGLSNVAPKRM